MYFGLTISPAGKMRPRNICLAVTTVLLLGRTSALAQAVSGTLVDESTGHPVAGASVLLLDSDTVARRGARTDESGAWSIRVSTGSGPYFIRVQKAGYATVETALFQIGEQPISMRLTTRPEVVTLEGVSSQRLTYEGILSRRERRMGYVMSPDEIAARIGRLGPTDTDHFLTALLPGIEIDPRTHGLLIPARVGRPGCSPIIVVVGSPNSVAVSL